MSKNSKPNVLGSALAVGFIFLISEEITRVAVGNAQSLVAIILWFTMLFLISLVLSFKFKPSFVLASAIFIFTAHSLLWIIAVTHGTFFESPSGWLFGPYSYLRNYLGARLVEFFLNITAVCVGAIIGKNFQKKKKNHA